ncbi:hypothetical protein [Deinococcus metallilatus]|uniref:Uncharacterized protein n=1 Tax=Deinococcus metallilatus TaxID=1211322 RepID=A0ABR6N014_9DEIO|nr:hypothetical protein [Deinococcus metallilatus]MBB5297486.1 hypothetical protein [Deinococcus metallilatus]
MNIDPARLYPSRALLPHLAGLPLYGKRGLEVVADVVQARAVLVVDGREVRVRGAGVFPADPDEHEGGAVLVVWCVQGDGLGVTLYVDL